MGGGIRKTGIEIIGDTNWGSHFCVFYRTKEDLIDILVPYFKAGLENNEFCLWVTSEPLGVKDAKAELKKAVMDLDDYIKKRQIEILDYSDWYIKSGKFKSHKVLQGWIEKQNQAIKKGFAGLRLSGNTFWLEKRDWRDFLDYEAAVNNLIGKYRILAVCTYSLDKCGASEIIDVVSTLQFALINKEGKWQLIESSEHKKYKEALSESETRYRDLVENTPDIIYSLDTAGNIISTNKAVKTMLGFEPEEVIGRNINEFISKGVLPKAMATFKQIIRGEKSTAETIVIDKDKKWHNLEILSTPIIKDKKVVGMLGVIRDITERKKAEETLRLQGEIMTNVSEGIVLTEVSNATIVYTNPKFDEMFGYAKGELVGKNISIVNAPTKKTPEEVAREIQKSLKKKGIWNGEVYNIKKDDTPFWCYASVSTFEHPENGKVWVGVHMDITERKKMEEELREKEKKWTSLTENTNDIVMIVDNKGKIQYINKTIPPYTPKETVGKSVYEYVPKEQHDTMRNSLTNVFKTGKPEAYEVCSVIPKLGTMWFSTKVVPIKIEENVVSAILISTDITERKRIEEALRESEKRYRMLAENVTDIIWTIDINLRFTYISPSVERIRGYSVKEAMAQSLDEVLTPSSHELVIKALEEELAIEKAREKDLSRSRTLELEHYRKDGSTDWIEARINFLRDAGGKPIGILGISRVITERKQAEQKLQIAYEKLKETQKELVQSSKMAAMGQLTAGISHELNQPLTGIKGFAQATLMALEENSPIREDLNKIVEQADRMDKIIKSARLFTRKSEFKLEEIDINQPIEDSLMLLSKQLKVNNIRLKISLSKGLPKIKGDSNQLQQVFLNLITNAKDAIDSLNSPESGEVIIKTSLSKDKNNIEIIFQDTGCGITPEDLENIFNPFFTTKSSKGGTGLGLSIAYRIINDHQGAVQVESQVGKGTALRITLPITQSKNSKNERRKREKRKT